METQRNLPTNGMAISSLVLGIITLPFSFVPVFNFLALLTGIVGIVLGAVGIRQVKRNPDAMKGSGLALTGLLLSVAGVVITIAMLVLFFLALSQLPADLLQLEHS
jgi:hypothetical protein